MPPEPPRRVKHPKFRVGPRDETEGCRLSILSMLSVRKGQKGEMVGEDFLTHSLPRITVPRLAIPNLWLGSGSPKSETLALPSFAYTSLE